MHDPLRDEGKGVPGKFVELEEVITFDPAENLYRESRNMMEAPAPSFRVWRSRDCVVLGRFLNAGEEVYLDRSERLGVPVLKRPSGGGAVFHDLGNINYSLYLLEEHLPAFGVEASLRTLSFPVTRLLDEMGVSWRWMPPNDIYVEEGKISGSAQARSRGRVLHHGTLLARSDLDKLRHLLKEGGRSRVAPVANLLDGLPGVSVEDIEAMLKAVIRSQDVTDLTRQ